MPLLPPGFELLMQMFWDLNSERQIGFTAGPIPISKVYELAERNGLDSDSTHLLLSAVREMDREYMRWLHKKHESAKAAKKRG